MPGNRVILREQQEMLLDFLEENKDIIMSKSLTPRALVVHQAYSKKWAKLVKQLNTVDNGARKTPYKWKRYWIEWRYKCKKKATDARRFQSASHGGPNRFMPLNDLEIRLLELSSAGSVNATVTSTDKHDMTEHDESMTADESDSDQNHEVPQENPAKIGAKIRYSIPTSKTVTDENSREGSGLPPIWALDLEERRIAAEERVADALESMVAIMKTQEDRRSILDERLADAVAGVTGTIQDLNSSLQEALQRLQQKSTMNISVRDPVNVYISPSAKNGS